MFLEIFHYQDELTTLIYNKKFKHRSVKLQKHGTFTKHFVWSCPVYKLPNPHLPLSPHLPILIPSDLLCCYVFMLHGSSTKLFNKSSAVPMFHHITLPCCHPATQKPLPAKNPPKKKKNTFFSGPWESNHSIRSVLKSNLRPLTLTSAPAL